MEIRKKSVLSRGNSMCKDPEARAPLAFQGIATKLVWLVQNHVTEERVRGKVREIARTSLHRTL